MSHHAWQSEKLAVQVCIQCCPRKCNYLLNRTAIPAQKSKSFPDRNRLRERRSRLSPVLQNTAPPLLGISSIEWQGGWQTGQLSDLILVQDRGQSGNFSGELRQWHMPLAHVNCHERGQRLSRM